MAQESDEDRIRHKAHELWEAEGRPHGRDQDHWDQAKEIVAIQDSMSATLLPRDTGAEEPIEEADEALRNLADFPNLTDQGENLLTSTDREPSYTAASEAGMPSVEIPTSDQPGVPEKLATSPASTKTSSTPVDSVPTPPPVSKPRTASVAKAASTDAVKSGTLKSRAAPKKPSASRKK